MRLHAEAQDRTNFPSAAYLKVNSCGSQHNRGCAFTTLRAAGRVDYHILYVTEGAMTAEHAGVTYPLEAGDFAVYEPHERQLYSFPAGAEVRTCWVHFTGTAAEEIMNTLGLRGGVYRGAADPLIRQMFERLSGMDDPAAADAAVQNGTLLTLLGFLARRAADTPATGTEAVSPAIRLMRREYARTLSVEECAAACSMSTSRFQHVFREAAGMSPHRYLLRIRLAMARDLLLHTELRVSEAGAQCGFGDPLYFSRIFRRECGASPREWRAQRGGAVKNEK